MKTTFLGTLLVILTILSSASFAQNPKECENLDREACNIFVGGKNTLEKQRTNRFAWNLKFFAPVSINETIPLSSHIVGQKVFNLDEKAKVEPAPDTGSSKVLNSGYFKVLAMNGDHTRILVEHVRKSLDDIIIYGRSRSREVRTEATEVYFIEATDLASMNANSGHIGH